MLSGTLRPTADMWVVVHLNKKTGGINAVYGTFDNWDKAREYANRLPGDQRFFAHVKPVHGVG